MNPADIPPERPAAAAEADLQPPSLRARLLRNVLGPMAIAWLAGGVVAVGVASVFTQRAFDRALLDDAYSVAASVRPTRDSLELTLTPREVGAVLFDQTETVYFAVRLPDGTLIAGHANLYAPSAVGGASYRFSDIHYQGHALRAVTLERGGERPFTVIMGETTQTRQTLLRNVLVLSVLPQLGLLALLAFWLRRAIGRDLQPLAALQHAMDQRDVHDLSPVAAIASTSEIQRLGEAVNGLFARVGGGVRAQREFAGNVAHELRTPLAGIRALAEYGLAQNDPAAWREQLERIARSEERASHLVDQLLAMARADEGPALRMGPVALDVLVRDAVLRFLPRADAAGVDLGARGIDDPVVALGHAALLEGIVNNLLDNALRYGLAPPQTPRSITVEVVQEGETVTLCVVDNGPGISVEQRGRLQQRWSQGPEGQWLRQGMGLGLAIIARYAQLMEAPLHLGDAPGGQGLAVSVTLPRA